VSAAPQLSMGGAAIQMAVGLLLILAVILLAFYILRRYGHRLGMGGPAKAHAMRIEGHLALGPRKNIMVVRFLNKLLVLGVTDQSINLLTEVDTSDEDEDFKAALDKAVVAGRDSGGPGDPGGSGPGPGG